MILRNRVFERRQPHRDAKSIFIFCEGAKREYQYFKFFKEIDSRINVEVYELNREENNSPNGLFQIAENAINASSKNNFSPLYNFVEGDEVWIVVDADPDKLSSRAPQIRQIRQDCAGKKNWFVVESNPCFEVWLYYHFYATIPTGSSQTCKDWKGYLSRDISGGFNSRKHPILIADAIVNSKNLLSKTGNELKVGDTQVYLLGETIMKIMGDKIRGVRANLI